MKEKIRVGCKDMWNAFMVCGAKWSANDVPICPTTVKVAPENVISFAEAKTFYNRGDWNSRKQFEKFYRLENFFSRL